jgi:hypothetical protein
VLDQRGRLLRAALGFAGLPRPSYDRSLWALCTWLDSWAGSGGSPWGWRTRSELLFRDGSDLAAYLPTRLASRVDVCVSRASPNGGDHRGKVPRHELLGSAPAMTLAAVIVPVTLPCCGQGGARPVGSGLVAV